MKYIFGLFAMLYLGVSAQAGGWVSAASIDYITVQPNGNVYVKLTVAVPDLGCSGNSFGILQLDTDAPHYNSQYSLLLAAQMSDRIIDVYVDGCGYYPFAQNTRVKSN